MNSSKDITALILAGGKSERMGTDKAFIDFNGQSFIESSIGAVKPFCHRIIILGDPAKYAHLGYEVIPDLIENSGPLAGLYTGLSNSLSEVNVALSCDIPFIESGLVGRLLKEYDSTLDALVCESNRLNPLVGIYHKRTAPIAKQQLECNQRSMMKFLGLLDYKTLELHEEETHILKNINTPIELKELL